MKDKLFSTKPIATDAALLILRIAFGGLMAINHGLPKLNKLMSEDPVKFFPFLGLSPKTSLILAVFAELFCAILLLFGLFTRWALVPLIITMLVAAVMVHGSDPFSEKEHALLFLLPYIALLLTGPGKYSLDGVLGGRMGR